MSTNLQRVRASRRHPPRCHHPAPLVSSAWPAPAYCDGVLVAEDFPAADVSDHLADPAATVWLDLGAPTE
jgi:hypothetical protein